jgi:PKD repeat protein
LVSLLLTAGSFALFAPGAARADSAPLDPANPATPTTVTADPLPTVQIDGVAWSQVVVGNTVYVAGSFTKARPAGAPAGTSEVVRNNLLAYDIRTGALIDSFAHDLNAQGLAVTASPDGSRIYVGGDFSAVDGQTRYRMAAFDTATGALVANFHPSVNGRVRAIAATDSTVYFGGNVQAVGSYSRTRLAAVSAANGALLPWAPVPGVGSTSGNRDGNTATSNEVLALVLTGNGSQVVAAGRFDSLNGVKATGVGALDPVTGATRPFAINQLITNQGVNSAIYSLSTDGPTVYGTAYDFYGPGDLEGSFAVAADTGAIRWINDCRGDTYSSFPLAGALYQAGHPHDCSNIGGYPEQTPRLNKFATAVSLAPAGVVGPKTLTNGNFAGKPAPALQDWFPTLTPGTFTGQSQAGWTVSGTGRYVVYGGEFLEVNGRVQQGLVRFALPDIAPNKVGPYGFTTAPTATSPAPGQAQITWTTTNDRDNQYLTYAVYREGEALPVQESVRASTWWQNGQMTATDAGVSGTLRYRVTATDPFGNTVSTDWVSVQVAPAVVTAAYADRVRADGAQSYWRLGEKSGTAADAIGGRSMTVGSGVTRGVTGALVGDADTAYSFAGTSVATTATQTASAAPNTFTEEAWFQTASTTGGRILGYANSASGTSSVYDRQVYLDSRGRVNFGVNAPFKSNKVQVRTVTSSASFNDGRWHHVAASMSSAGMALYVDGKLVGSRTDTTTGQAYSGYFRLGSDRAMGGSSTFSGRIDEVAIYPKALSAAQVGSHAAGSTNQPPAARFSSTATFLTATFDASRSVDVDGGITGYAWNFGDGSTGSGATVSHTYVRGGTYLVELTVTDGAGATSKGSQLVQVAPEPPNEAPAAAFTSSVADLRVSVDGSTSADSDGSVVSYDWDFGDGSTGTGVAATHDYSAAGTYPVRLTVTDDDGATDTVEQAVTVTAPRVNQAPTAAFTSTASDLTVAVDASGSTDPDGSMASYAWDFGDGSTATGVTSTHAYGAAGTYTLRLTVTDNDGASAVTERAVTVGAPPLARDTFERAVASGFGTAEVGGNWTMSGGSASVSGGVGHLQVATAGGSAAALLNAVQVRDVALQAGLSLDQAPTGGGTYAYLVARRSAGNNQYRVAVRFTTDGKVTLTLLRMAAGTEITLKAVTLPATYTPGTVLQVRFDVAGAETTTLSAKAWTTGAAEPTAWQVSATDVPPAALQVAGGIGVSAYLAGSATAPLRLNVDDLWAGAAGTAPTVH